MRLMNKNSHLFYVQVLNTTHIRLVLYDENLMPQKKFKKERFDHSLTCHVTSNPISQTHNKYKDHV